MKKIKVIKKMLGLILLLFIASLCLINTDNAEEIGIEKNLTINVIVTDTFPIVKNQNKDVATLKLKTKNILKGYSTLEIAELRALVYAESGNQSLEGQSQVLFCVLNRIRSKSHDFKNINTIHEAIYQNKQFSCVTDGGYDRAKIYINDGHYSETFDELISGINNGDYINNGNLFYCRDYCNSWHRNNLQYVETVGLHEFYKYKEK